MTLPPLSIDSSTFLSHYFMPHQLNWIEAEGPLHAQGKPAFAIAEKSVRIGWTYADAFKNVRKRLHFKKRDYLFATKDYPSALEYMQLCYTFAGLFDFTRAVLSHGEDYLQVPRLDSDGQPTGFTDEIKVGLIKFDNGSRIIAFSSNPRAMAVYAGDVGLDEFAKHPNARLLWETAQARVTWNYDLAIWSAHDGEDTLFNQFAQQARATCNLSQPLLATLSQTLSPTSPNPSFQSSSSTLSDTSSNPSPIKNQNSKIQNPPTPPTSPWNLYYRVTITDAIQLGLLDVINRVQGTNLTADQFIANCRSRAGSEEIFQQSYMCNPMGAATANIVEWSAIERCRTDYKIERLHLEADDIRQRFAEFSPQREKIRESQIQDLLRESFPALLSGEPSIKNQKSEFKNPTSNSKFCLGFDVAASGQGDLAVLYIDEAKTEELWLRALLTCRTEDWHFLKTVLFFFLKNLRRLQAAGDETGLGRQICWEAARQFSSRFTKVNIASLKHDLGFTLMNQLSVAKKRFPRSEQDIASDYFALRKVHTGSRWIFTEGRNTLNPASHCDIAWAGALATHAHSIRKGQVGAAVALEHGCYHSGSNPEAALLLSNDPRIWRSF